MTGKRSGRKSSDRGPGHRGRASLVTRLARAAALLALLLALGLGAVVLAFGQDLPDTSRLAERGRRPSVTLVAADGTPITTIGGFYGEAVDIRDLPPYLPKAVHATEDRRFYDHFGFDPVAIGRAVVANVRAGRIVQGGSTITQQLAKNLFLTPERTIRRKVQETLLAFWLESRFDKDEILAIYLNRMYFGAGTYGIDAAAQRYFGKPAKSLGLHESALLAGLLKAPSRYNPGRAGSPSVERAQQVLDNMVAAGYLSPEQGQAAKRRPSRPRPLVASRGAQYFVDWAFDQVSGFVGYPDRDIVVRTTLDMGLQRVAEAKIEAALAADGASAGASQAALVLTAPDGAVRAMVGGRDYAASQFNRATQALRQPGSAFKLFVYLAALEQGLRPSDRFVDSPISIGGWRPKNFDGGYVGEVSMTEAFARSINTVAAQVGERMGRRRIEAMARRLGITSELHMDATIALGTSEVTLLELTQSYATVANGGTGVWTYGIDEIRTRQGQILYRRQAAGPGAGARGGRRDERDARRRAHPRHRARRRPGTPGGGEDRDQRVVPRRLVRRLHRGPRRRRLDRQRRQLGDEVGHRRWPRGQAVAILHGRGPRR